MSIFYEIEFAKYILPYHRIKGLLWDETGFLLLYKRLEDGKYQWPDEPKDVLEISEQQLRWLTEGLTISPSKLVRKVHPHLTI